MRETGIGTSLILLAGGAVLAFGVTAQTTGVDINAIGLILMVVGIIGLAMSFIFLNGIAAPRATVRHRHVDAPPREPSVTTREVVYEDEVDGSTRVERTREIRH